MRVINSIVVHCSASSWGTASTIESWHKSRGFKCRCGRHHIGYHFVIRNAYPERGGYAGHWDGHVELGRPIEEVGAHCKGFNRHSIGICLIGNPTARTFAKSWYTKQQIESLLKLLKGLCERYAILPERVFGHYELGAKKLCPGFSLQQYRKTREII